MAKIGVTQQMEGNLEGITCFTGALGEVGQAIASPGNSMEQVRDLLPDNVTKGTDGTGVRQPASYFSQCPE